VTVVDAVDAALARIRTDGRDSIWITLLDPADVRAAATAVDRRLAMGETLPLAGATLAVKDNIDVADVPTTAGCPGFAFTPTSSAPAVQRLVDAGAVVVGKTNMDQFATGLVGVRSPHGVAPNAHWPGLIPGGSSSGSAVAVAAGLVDLALGTDTAGSGRVPAACNGIVGVKPTRGWISNTGVIPACRSLDCVSVFARSVDEASLAASIAGGVDDADPWSRRAPRPIAVTGRLPRIGVPAAGGLTFDGDAEGPARYTAAVAGLLDAIGGAEVVDADLSPFLEVSELLYGASFVAERYEAVGPFVDAHRDDVDPVVGSIISAAGDLPAWAVFRDQTELVRLAGACRPIWQTVDALVVPSVPRVPTVAEVQAEPYSVNAMLGTYTNFVNLLDLCAVTVPVGPGTATHPPASLTLIGPAWSDDVLVSLARRLGTPASRRGA
jgi:allophanate hydrolase